MHILTRITAVCFCLLLVSGSVFALDTTSRQNIGKTFTGVGSSTDRILASEEGATCTFSKDFRVGNSVNADYGRGDLTGTYTTVRTSSTPATYVDESGVVQKTNTSNIPRFQGGYYDATGFVRQPGLMIELASENLIKMSSFASDGTNWTLTDDVTATPTVTYADATDLINISGAQSQNTAVTFTDGTYLIQYTDLSAVGSVAQNDLVNVSMWMKGEASGVTVKLRVKEYDAAGVGGTTDVGDDLVASLSTTEWRRFSYTYTSVDADASRATASYVVQGQDNGDTMDISITGVQLEVKPVATSLVPTTTAALTRNAEKLLYVATDNRTMATESMVMRYALFGADSITQTREFLDNDGNRRVVYINTGTNDVTVLANLTDEATSAVPDLINDSWTPNALQTIGYSMQSGSSPYIAGFYNGAADGTNETADDFSAPGSVTSFSLGSKYDGTIQMNGIVQAIAFFSDVKSEADHTLLNNLMTGGK